MAPDRYRYFRIEAREILDQLSQGALDLEKAAPAPDLVARLLRLAHTLKGAARVVKQREIADGSHELEDVLLPFQDGSRPVSRDGIDRVLSIVDGIGQRLAQIDQPAAEPRARPNQPDPVVLAVRPDTDELDALLRGLVEAHVRVEALRPRLAQVERARVVATLIGAQLERPPEAEAVHAGSRLAYERARSMAEDLAGMFSGLSRDLTSNIDQLDRELRQVRAGAERLRLAPAGALFTFLERAARDVAQELGKRMIFTTAGGEVRVDASVLQIVQHAFLHVVRNAVAHGLEAGDSERIAAGKPVEGRVTVRVAQRGRLVSFACTDDGRGIDLDAVRRVVERRGLGATAGPTPDTDELLRLLLKGGISTSSTVTDVAGRGIGLDVVRDAAERLGGTVTATTDAGRGTTIELVVPLTIASLQALVVDVGDATLAIPLDAVRRTARVGPEEQLRTPPHASVMLEGQAIPLVSLRQAVSLAPSPARSAASSAVIVQGQTGVAAFRVDRILGTAQIVMHPLPAFAPALKVVAGAAIDAVGEPQLVLDPDHLVAGYTNRSGLSVDAMPSRRSVLVIDDSLTTRMLEQSILESAGYDVDLATSGEEGLGKARVAPYALFLVDVEMPGMDGFEFVERIRADGTLRHVPAILMTSRSSGQDRQRGQEVGAQAYMVKSEFDQGVLLERIRALVG